MKIMVWLNKTEANEIAEKSISHLLSFFILSKNDINKINRAKANMVGVPPHSAKPCGFRVKKVKLADETKASSHETNLLRNTNKNKVIKT